MYVWGFLSLSVTAAKVNFQQGFFRAHVCAQSTCVSFHFKCRYKILQKWYNNFSPCICTHKHSLASNSPSGLHCLRWCLHTPTLKDMPEIFKVQMKYTHKRSWPLKTQATAGNARAQKAGASLSPRAGALGWLPGAGPCRCRRLHRSECRRSDLGEFSAGNCSGSLVLSSLYPSGLPAMMTALLALNCLTEHEGWFQLARAQGRARRACTTKIYGSSAIDFKGCRTKSLGAIPCITNSRNSLWFPLRAIRELYILLCLELKILVSKTNPKLNHRTHLIFVHG